MEITPFPISGKKKILAIFRHIFINLMQYLKGFYGTIRYHETLLRNSVLKRCNHQPVPPNSLCGGYSRSKSVEAIRVTTTLYLSE
jgi:hypothetical protein